VISHSELKTGGIEMKQALCDAQERRVKVALAFSWSATTRVALRCRATMCAGRRRLGCSSERAKGEKRVILRILLYLLHWGGRR